MVDEDENGDERMKFAGGRGNRRKLKKKERERDKQLMPDVLMSKYWSRKG